jgi:hypothetical protein
MRIVVSIAAICLGTPTAMAASPKIEAAVKTFKAVAADPARLKLFCAMNAALDDAAEKKDKAAAAKIPALMKQIGPDFESAWNAGEDVDDDTPDGKVFVSAIDELADKCP